MNWKSEKGFTGTDMAVSVVVLFIFVSIISILSYNFNSSAKEVELKYEATQIAIDEIEKLKGTTNFSDIKDFGTTQANSIYQKETEVTGKQGFFETVTVTDFAYGKEDVTPGIVKKLTVKIQYKFKGNIETVELSTKMAKEN